MGWSGHTPLGRHAGLDVRVDAHGGEREERGERLYEEFIAELDAAIAAVVRNPKYADRRAIEISWWGLGDEVTNSPSVGGS